MKSIYALSVTSSANLSDVSVEVPIPNYESAMIPNRGGGFCFKVSDKTLVERILILGIGDGYYSSAASNTQEAVNAIKTMLQEGKSRIVLDVLKDVYTNNRAAKLDPTFVVLALLCHDSHLETRREACEIVSSLSTFSHLCTFLKYYIASGKPKTTSEISTTSTSNSSGCWGRLMKKTLANWVKKYNSHDLLYQVFKYLSRDGWTFRDVLRCIHIKPTKLPIEVQMSLKVISKYGDKNINSEEAFNNAIDFGRANNISSVDIEYIEGIKFMKTCAETVDIIPQMVEMIQKHNFTHEFVPKWALKEKEIWVALLLDRNNHIKMPMTALIRNLGVMTSRGVFDDPTIVDQIVSLLNNHDAIKRSRIHPATLTIAWKQYEQGRGEKGKNTWTPVKQIVDALEKAIYLSFGNVEPTNKKILHAFDASGSMTCPMTVLPCMTSAEAVALLGLICSKSEQSSTQQYVLFSNNNIQSHSYNVSSTGLRPISFRPNSSLKDAARVVQISDWGTTNCSLPIDDKIKLFKQQYETLANVDKILFQNALRDNDQVLLSSIRDSFGIFFPEVFVIYTDNDVNSGRHPALALKEYRELTGILAKFAVVATTASKTSIADPKDAFMLDFVGFDASLPQLLRDFIANNSV